MVTRAACASTAWLTSTTWATIDATSFSNSETANTVLTTSYVESSAFTPGAITIDGHAVKIASRPGSTGTISSRLAIAGVLVAGTEVTVNVSDLPTATATTGTTTPVGTAEGGWFFFKYAAPVLLVTATNYTVSAKTSSSTQVNLWSTATSNWSRYLRTTTTGNMASGDDAIITKEWTAANTGTARTVTMNETATTDYGGNTTSQVTPSLAICQGGTLTFSTGIAANLRQSGYVVVYNGGTLNIGSSGAEVARGSTAVLQFDCAADGDFGLVARNGATVNMAGLSRTSGKNVSKTLLNANAAASATSITIVDDTGWLNTDLVCLAPTTQTNTQFESKALTGDATATTAAISALTNAHSGTSPTQAEVGLITRNVQMVAVTANTVTFFYVGTTATVSLFWTDFRYISTNSAGKRGIEIATTTGSFNMQFCTVRDTDACHFLVIGTGNSITIENSVFYNGSIVNPANGVAGTIAGTGAWTINNNMFCGQTTGPGGIILGDVGGTFTNNSVSGLVGGASAGAVWLTEVGGTIGTFSGNQIHSNAIQGILISANCAGTITSDVWRHASKGISLTGSPPANTPVILSSCNIFGNSPDNISIGGLINLTMISCTMNGDTTFGSTGGITFVGTFVGKIAMYSCLSSVVSGIKTKCSNDILFSSSAQNCRITADNCIFNGTSVYGSNVSVLAVDSVFLQAQNFGQVSNDNRTYIGNGTTTAGLIQSNASTVYGTNVLSEQMTPASTTVKLVSQSIFVECGSGKTATPVVQVQKNGTYNGNAPRLIVKRQDSMGVTSDTVLATFSASANTWQGLTGTTVTSLQAGVFEFVIDCDGTAGSVFVGDATATTA